ncbi:MULTISPECIES: lantibiotic dehydratase [Streptomyces]|uniref:lantibiotic dehydratase n=1 Tax=Streptomyces TaxID=1883 RepID=UPI002248AF0B|nr:lantibiotic dehydratase [Streptomyces sp. JHD 1]MCX2968614.1 lantibiotic dehydratase [Streptomyces sp. JHD 1]
MYRYVDAALLRAAAYPSGLALPPRPEPTGDAEADAGRSREWITQVWAIGSVAEAVELSSPVLARRIEEIRTGRVRQPKQVRRAAGALARYVLRFRHRSTPFGLFAGVAPARIADTLTLDWTDAHQPTARVDSVWLADVIDRLESLPELLRRLPVVVDSTCFVRDGRLVVPFQRPDRDSDRGPGEMSMRYTGAVQMVVDATTVPVTVADLAAKLAAEYRDTPARAIDALLAELVARRVLLTAVRPPMTVTDPLGHVITALETADAVHVEAARPLLNALKDIRATLTRHDAAPASQRRSLRGSAAGAMTALAPAAGAPLSVDLRLGAAPVLPHLVAREAAKAASVLARLTPFPSGSASWQDYHARFLETYGPGALVPVRQLTDPDTGLDFPAGYRGSRRARPTPTLTVRDEQLLALAQHAAFDGTREVPLTDAMLTGWEHAQGSVPLPHIDLRFHLQARTRQAVENGDFHLHVNGIAPAAGATAGRFLDLFDAADRDRMTTAYTSLPTLASGASRVQVSSPALHIRTDNVGRAPALEPDVISIAEHHSGALLEWDDLAVTADVTGFRLVRLSTGHTIEPYLLNAVDLSTFTHPLARLLVELPRARAAAFGPFAWGAAARLPFLPRIRYGRTVLSPATWRLTTADLPSSNAEFAPWAERLSAWRHRLGVPGAVHLGDDDQRLRLNLEQRADTTLLRAELDRAGHAVLREAADETAWAWIDGRPHEITLTLASTAPPTTHRHEAGGQRVVGRDHGHVPGTSNWAYLKLYSHPDRVPGLLIRHLPRLLDGFDQTPAWWYVRYRDPHDHLRLRFHLPHPHAFGEIAAQAGAWAADLRQRGLLGRMQWDTYYPETGRYGTGMAMAAAETVFAADSAAALAHLTCAADSGADPHALITAGLVNLVVSFTSDTPRAMRWLIDHIDPTAASHPARPLHQEAMRLANPADDFAAVRALPGGQALTTTWGIRRQALRRYRSVLAATSTKAPETVLPSLMHLHYLRAAGIDPAGEDTCSRLARSAALSDAARHQGARA